MKVISMALNLESCLLRTGLKLFSIISDGFR